jgi:hypothetical protein
MASEIEEATAAALELPDDQAADRLRVIVTSGERRSGVCAAQAPV